MSFSSSLLIPSEGASEGIGRDKVPDFRLGCTISNVQEDELLAAKVDTVTLLGLAVEILERYLSVQFRDSLLTLPEGLLLVLDHDANHRGMTAGLGLLMLLCRSSQARQVVHTLLFDPLLHKSKLSPLGGLQEGGAESGGLSAGELRSLRTCNRMARCMMMRIVATRASTCHSLQQECVKWRFGNYLVDACRDGEEAEQLAAVDALLSLMPAQSLRGDALKAGAVAALLERLVCLTERNRQLIDSMTRTIQAYRDARVLITLTKIKVRELEEQIRATEAVITQRVTDGKEDDPQLIQHVSSLKLQRSSSEQDGSRAGGVMKDSKTRFAETNGFLEDNHRQLQATVLALACLSASDQEAQEELCRRLSVALLLSLLDSTPFNLGVHWAVLHLLGTLLLPPSSPNTKAQHSKHTLQQDNSLAAGLLAYLVAKTIHAAKAWLPHGRSADDASVTYNAVQSGITTSDSEASGNSLPPQPKSIEEADAKLKAHALDVVPDMCPQCFSHAMEVLFQCVHSHGDACRAILDHHGGIQPLLTVSGIMPGRIAPPSADLMNAPGAVTCVLKTDASSVTSGNYSGSSMASSGINSSAPSNTTPPGSSAAPVSSTSSRQPARGCDHCRGSQPFVHGTSVRQPYPASLYNLLWARNGHGQAQPLDIVTEIIRHERSGQESLLQEGCLPVLVSTLCQQDAAPQSLVALLNVLTCQLVPAPFPPDTHPGRAYAHDHLDMEDMGTLYHESARQLHSEGVTDLLLDFVTGRRLGHLRFQRVGAKDVMPVVLAMRSLGRFCLSAPMARKVIVRMQDTRRETGTAEGAPEQTLTSGFDVLLLILLHGDEYVRLAGCDIAPLINVKPVALRATSEEGDVDATVRQEAAGCLASMAWNHKALQSRIAQRGGDELFSVLLTCLTKNDSPMLQSQCCRLIVTVVQYAVDIQEKMARKGIVNQLINLLDSPRSSVVIYASQALESCVTGCLEAQEQLQNDSQFRALWRVIGNKVVPGGYSSKCAALKALSAILAVHNNNRQKAGTSGLVGPVTKMVRVEDDAALRSAAIDALEHLIHRHAANWRDVTQVGGVNLLLLLCQHAKLSTTRSTALVQLSLLCKHCPEKLKAFLKLQGVPLLLDFVRKTSEDMTNAITAMQALCALLDHECVREEALQHEAHHVLSSLLTGSTAPDAQDSAPQGSVPSYSDHPAASLTELAPASVSTTLEPAMARDACLCLAKLAGESMAARDMLVADTELMALLQSLGAKAGSLDLSQAATVGWASLTRGPQFGNLHFSMTGWPDFGEGLRASYTLPVLNED